MACGGESGMDACRAGEHPPAGTPLFPKPVHGSGANTLSREKILKKTGAEGRPLVSCSPWRASLGPVSLHARRRQHLRRQRSEAHTSDLQALMRISYAVFRL